MDKIKDLLDRYIADHCSPAEKLQVEDWLDTYYRENNEWNMMDEDAKEHWLRILLMDIHYQIDETAQRPKIKSPFRLIMNVLGAAACLLVLLSAGIWFFKAQRHKEMALSLVTNDRKPGGNKAYLTLASGRRIELGDAESGQLADETGIRISKTAEGALVYTIKDQKNSTYLTYNSVETPKGGQYQIQLPDGTKVWLNSASTLYYPVNFTSASERRVRLSGEAYFEVAKDQTKPFIVATGQHEVKVLGTHFNINGYADEHVIKTTLLEGTVMVREKGLTAITLKPDEESICSAAGIKVRPANVRKAVAWKNGYFIFNEESLGGIMKTIARWYDVEVVFKDDVQNLSFIGVISRTKNISSVLQLLQETGNVHFKMEGRSVIVMK